jgi:hypothetical protein
MTSFSLIVRQLVDLETSELDLERARRVHAGRAGDSDPNPPAQAWPRKRRSRPDQAGDARARAPAYRHRRRRRVMTVRDLSLDWASETQSRCTRRTGAGAGSPSATTLVSRAAALGIAIRD